MATEESVGIRVFVTQQKGFTGILRHKYTDFKVNEVDLSGKVAHLTSYSMPENPPGPPKHQASNEGDVSSLDTVDSIVEAYTTILGPTIPATKSDELTSFLQQAQSNKSNPTSTKKPRPVDLDIVAEKDQRRALHQLFKDIHWLPPLNTQTIGSGDTSVIQLSVSGRGGGGADNRKRKRWDEQNGWNGGTARYLRFVLYKENEDTHAALNAMARILHLKPKLFSVAGTKDKRAVTVQYATAFKVNADKLIKINSRMHSIRVGNFEYCQDDMRLGDLQGNKFEIILRGITISNNDGAGVDKTSDENDNKAEGNPSKELESIVSNAAATLQKSGFVNYYGLQRFGSTETSTHEVGAALLQGLWEKAIHLLMAPGSSMKPEIQEALDTYLKTGDAKAALSALPPYFVAARAVLTVLSQSNGANQHVYALTTIPRNLRTMYIHAFQSYLWNEAASERVLRHGIDKVVKGDLILSRKDMIKARTIRHHQEKKHQGKSANLENDEEEEEEEEENADDDLVASDFIPHIVSAEEASSGKYNIEDVVLPLPGKYAIWPENDIKDVYKQVAEKHGVSLEGGIHKVKEFTFESLAGTYRHLMFRPDDLEYEVVNYDDMHVDLAKTELQVMEKKNKGGVEDGGSKSGKYLGLKLSFTLPASTYATMLIRELTKMPTTMAYIKSLRHPE